MATILAISSQVACGSVGLSAAAPIFAGFGHELIGIPTIFLSNHPGHPSSSSHAVPAAALRQMVDAVTSNGWLAAVDCIATGYLPTPSHAELAVQTVDQVKSTNPNAIHVCDPILGDDPNGLYISESVATVVRDKLLPTADIATPNRFELAWLTRLAVNSAAEAAGAARALGVPEVLATSIPGASGTIANVLVAIEGAFQAETELRSPVPKGTGDAMTAAFVSQLWNGSTPPNRLARSVAIINAIVSESLGAAHLKIAPSGPIWQNAAPVPVLAIAE